MEFLTYIVIAALGALAAILANRGIAVFNDGFRPVMPEYFEGRMDRKSLAATSFAISFGLVVGFGLPVSIAAAIILIHSILLTTDIIGVFCPHSKIGLIVSGVLGGLYGVLLLVGLQFIIDAIDLLPINFLGPLGQVATPIIVAFATFPAVAAGMQFGFKKGLITAAATLLVRQITQMFLVFTLDGGATIALNPDGMAMLTGMLVLIFFAIRDKEGSDDTSNQQLAEFFQEKVKRIRKNIPLIAVMGGLVSAATSLAMVAGDPISLNLLAEGSNVEAAMVAFARAIGFIPLVATTAIATGVYAPAGMTFVFVIGLLFAGGGAVSPLLAFILGAAVITIEVLLLTVIAKALDKFPGVRRCSDNIRTAMGRVLEIALLVGGMMAAHAMAPGFGLLIVVAVYCFNKITRKPMVDMAVGPVGAILTGVLINILAVLRLFPMPS
jgi:hypothetical protein